MPLLEHGLFIAPYHDVDESPTIALRRDLEFVEAEISGPISGPVKVQRTCNTLHQASCSAQVQSAGALMTSHDRPPTLLDLQENG